jgi:4'-phosphopantetheinyl transferase
VVSQRSNGLPGEAEDIRHREPLWLSPQPGLVLSADEVHLWRAFLDQSPEQIGELGQTLSDEERARARRFHFDRDRRRFIVGRGVLRTILGQYLGFEPAQVRFSLGPHGKPYLADGPGDCKLCFNLAHSSEIALYAFSLRRKVGVDVEQLRFLADAEQIAEHFFSPGEKAVWDSLPPAHRQAAFYNCWTRKEAYIKATGKGLSERLDLIDVSLAPGEQVQVLSVAGDRREALRWSMMSLTPAPEYVAALVVEGHGWQLRCWQYG